MRTVFLMALLAVTCAHAQQRTILIINGQPYEMPPGAGVNLQMPTQPAPQARQPQEDERRGAINPRSGAYYPPTAGGVINPWSGEFYPRVGGGYINPQTGEFFPRP